MRAVNPPETQTATESFISDVQNTELSQDVASRGRDTMSLVPTPAEEAFQHKREPFRAFGIEVCLAPTIAIVALTQIINRRTPHVPRLTRFVMILSATVVGVLTDPVAFGYTPATGTLTSPPPSERVLRIHA